MKIKAKFDTDYLLEIVQENMFGLESIGLCIDCGAEREGTEPDAQRYLCDECGNRSVYGAEKILMQVESEIT